MKKLLIPYYLFFIFLLINCSAYKEEASQNYNYFNNYDINLPNIDLYKDYSTFDPNKYSLYEKARIEKKYSILEALNYINYPNYFEFYKKPKKAVFVNTNLLLVNKAFFLDNNYVPSDLVSINGVNHIIRENENMQVCDVVLSAYKKLESDAYKRGYNLYIFSAYRSYNKQYDLYYNVNKMNDATVARPGFSEHQSGLCLDVSTLYYGLTNDFENSDEFKWLKENAHHYGFILRYPKDKTSITGYSYESWHYRFVGEEIATFISQNNLTLEEYLFKYQEIK